MLNIQSLERAFAILELLADHPGQPLPLGQIAPAVELKSATCAHLINTLVELGYAEKLGRREGYVLGPKTFNLSRNGMYRRDLAARAEPVMVALARELSETVTLSALKGLQRILLGEVESKRRVQVNLRSELVAEDIYNAASTWLLMAHLPEEELRRFIACHGRPWFENAQAPLDEAALAAKLAELRVADFCQIVDPEAEICRLVCPIREQGRVTATVGVYLPAYRATPEKCELIRTALKRAAEQIQAAPAGTQARD